MNVSELVKKYLEENGFEGLFNVDAECACALNDIFPCTEYFGECEPGYKAPCPHNCDDHDFHIVRTKEDL